MHPKDWNFRSSLWLGAKRTCCPTYVLGHATNVDEERRLFYVGLTRAREKLILTYAHRRFLFGQAVSNDPSPFLGDIESALKEIKITEPPRPAARP